MNHDISLSVVPTHMLHLLPSLPLDINTHFTPPTYMSEREKEKAFQNMGAIDYLSDFCTVTCTRRKRKKPLQTVELSVKMDCHGCERRVRNAVCSLKGVTSVEVSRKQGRVTVIGYVDRSKVLKTVEATGKKVEFWPYVPYHLVYYPYAAQAYDRKAPPGYVRNVEQAAAPEPNASEVTYASIFSDENTNAYCSIM